MYLPYASQKCQENVYPLPLNFHLTSLFYHKTSPAAGEDKSLPPIHIYIYTARIFFSCHIVKAELQQTNTAPSTREKKVSSPPLLLSAAL